MARAILFDLDGTLLDSVDLHAQAWQEALARYGKDLPYEDVRAQIGKGGDQLLATLLSDEERERFGDELDEYRGDLFRRKYLAFVRPFPQARELLVRLKQAGVLVGLASSSTRQDLAHYLKLLDGASVVDAATSSDDAEASKPEPDIFEACLERLGVDPGEALAVGDSPWDAQSAARAGIPAVGVLSGGFPERALEAAGCLAVYQDVGEILTRLGTSPLALEPARAET